MYCFMILLMLLKFFKTEFILENETVSLFMYELVLCRVMDNWVEFNNLQMDSWTLLNYLLVF